MLSDGLEEFVSIVERGSVTGAAEVLALPRATVSKRLARLEERLGVSLLHRTTRRIALTEPGELLYERGRRIVHAVREAEAAIQRHDDQPRGLLRFSVPPAIPEIIFTQWLVEFMAEYPEVSLDVVISDAQVDLIAEGFDAALLYGPIKDDSLVSRTLAVNKEIAVASPEYLKAYGTPSCVEDLTAHQCIIGYKHGNLPEPHWPLLDGGSVNVVGKLTTNHGGMRLQAALRHVGIATVVERYAEPYLKSGALTQVLPEQVGQIARARLVYPRREFVEPKVRAFVDFMVSRVEATRRTEGD